MTVYMYLFYFPFSNNIIYTPILFVYEPSVDLFRVRILIFLLMGIIFNLQWMNLPIG